MSRERIYLDYNATAPMLPAVRAAFLDVLNLVGNPSSVHFEGRATRAVVEKARRQVAQLVGAEPGGVVFTSGATEAAATVLTPDFKMGKADLHLSRLLVSAVEHLCILGGGRFDLHDVDRIPVNQNGQLDTGALEKLLAEVPDSSGPVMVSLMLANNETGIVQHLEDAARIIKRHGGILVVDAVQAVGRMPVDILSLGADFLILSSHKIGGPKGAGALVCASDVLRPRPLIPGGGQEKGHRSGTENPAAIAGFGVAAQIASEGNAADHEKLGALRDNLERDISTLCTDCVFYGVETERLPNTSFFEVPGMKAETVQIAFDLEGIAVSAGSACSSGKVGPSHVLAAMGFDAEQGGVRVSIGPGTTEHQIEAFLAAFGKIISNRTPV